MTSSVPLQNATDAEIPGPLRVCVASVQDFGARCDGAPDPSLEAATEPLGSVPVGGWCGSSDAKFCGYDVSVWMAVAEDMGLVEGVDYEMVCMGEKGFDLMIDDLAGRNRSLGQCDLAASAITASSERQDMGISFSRATHRSALAVMVYAPLKQRGMWAFFQPLHLDVWMALLITIVVTPFFVFFFESIFSGRSAYTDKLGHLSILHGLKEALWHSISHTLSIDVFRVNVFPSRVITIAYGFLVMILTNTYTANLAAFLTVDQLDTTITSVSDLHGRAVATTPTYVRSLYRNHHIVASTADVRDYDAMVAKLRQGVYTAIISDDTQLIPRSYSDSTCALHILPDTIEPFDLAIAFRRGFDDDLFKYRVSRAILGLQEEGELADLQEAHEPPQPSCLQATEFSETNQVSINSLIGLWVILGAAIALSLTSALVQYALLKRGSEEQQKIATRAKPFRDSLTHVVKVAHVADAFAMAGSMRRQRSNLEPSTPSSASMNNKWNHESGKLKSVRSFREIRSLWSRAGSGHNKAGDVVEQGGLAVHEEGEEREDGPVEPMQATSANLRSLAGLGDSSPQEGSSGDQECTHVVEAPAARGGRPQRGAGQGTVCERMNDVTAFERAGASPGSSKLLRSFRNESLYVAERSASNSERDGGAAQADECPAEQQAERLLPMVPMINYAGASNMTSYRNTLACEGGASFPHGEMHAANASMVAELMSLNHVLHTLNDRLNVLLEAAVDEGAVPSPL